MKKIAPNEEFNLSGHIFTYTINSDSTLTFKKVKMVKNKPNFIPPTVDEVKAFFDSKGYTKEAAIKFHEYYSNGEPAWTDGGGKPVKSWRQKAMAVWFKNENRKTKSSDKSTFLF